MRRLYLTQTRICKLTAESGRISFILRKSPHRRTLEIRINDSFEVRVSAPLSMPDKRIQDFVQHKSGWILEKLKEAERKKDIISTRKYHQGQEFLFLGNRYPLNIMKRDIRKTKIDFNGQYWQICIPVYSQAPRAEQLIKSALINWYKKQAKELFGVRLFHFTRLMSIEPQRIAVKTQKHLWGSCGVKSKRINLNWQLILSPLAVLDYVIVHELSHLVFPNHSRRFWQKVSCHIPDYKNHRQWLKDNRLEMILP